MRLFGFSLVGFLLAACGGAVPTLTPAKLSSPGLTDLDPRTIAVSVVDGRSVTPEDRRETEDRVGLAFTEVLARDGVKVAESSPNSLIVTLRKPANAPSGIDPDSCVEMVGDLTIRDGRTMTAKSIGCAEYRNALGMSYGSHVSGAFQFAANTLLESMSEKYGHANAPLVFDAEKIKVPDFSRVGVSSLRLVVEDRSTKDGSLGKNLEVQLGKALMYSGVRVDERAPQTLVVELSEPKEDFAGRSRTTCLVVEATATLSRGTAFGRGTACRGLIETAHDQILGEALAALHSEYARLTAK